MLNLDRENRGFIGQDSLYRVESRKLVHRVAGLVWKKITGVVVEVEFRKTRLFTGRGSQFKLFTRIVY